MVLRFKIKLGLLAYLFDNHKVFFGPSWHTFKNNILNFVKDDHQLLVGKVRLSLKFFNIARHLLGLSN